MGRSLVHKYPLGFQLARGLLGGVLVTPAKTKIVRLCAKVDNIFLGSGPDRYRKINKNISSSIVRNSTKAPKKVTVLSAAL